MRGKMTDVLLLDVCPHSLGIDLWDGTFSVIIPRNSPVPITRSQIYTTNEDNQTSVHCTVYQGENHIAAQNMSLGKFVFSGIPPSKRF